MIVDDDPTVRGALADTLVETGANVTVAEGGHQALAGFTNANPDVVLCDVRMPEMDGQTLLGLLRERAPSVDVIMMTAYDDMPTVVAAMRGGAVEFLVKPIDLDQLLNVLNRVFEDRHYRRHAEGREQPPAQLGDIVGRDPRMIALYKMVGQAAATRATVLIRGESGSGKELVARAVHNNSAAASEPFVPVNCAALPSGLLETELFGHVRGSFSGAHENRRGRFALAGSGTIFLDEIGDTSLDLQSKLLRVIQEREFQQVGAERSERTEARVVAATHQDLESLVAARKFREDLYYRLRVVEVFIPPLRERVADIPLLAKHLVRKASTTLATAEPILSTEAIDRLIAHEWPGNVRELENCLMRAVVITGGNVIRPEHLSIALPSHGVAEQLSSLEQVERDQIVRVLAATDGQKGRAADILGISRPRLNRLLLKYGLE